MALFHFYTLNKFENPIMVNRAVIMETAKINGIATYHKCIKDLAQYGYIIYQPSFNPGVNTRVALLKV